MVDRGCSRLTQDLQPRYALETFRGWGAGRVWTRIRRTLIGTSGFKSRHPLDYRLRRPDVLAGKRLKPFEVLGLNHLLDDGVGAQPGLCLRGCSSHAALKYSWKSGRMSSER